jgi:hypothetical protein
LATPEEREHVSRANFEQAYRNIVQRKLGGLKIVAYSISAEVHGGIERALDVEAGDGTRFKCGFRAISENGRVYAGATTTLAGLMRQYHRAAKNPNPLSTDYISYFRENLEEAGVTRFYHFRSNVWYTLDELERIERILW